MSLKVNKFSDLFEFQKKSKVKAGEGLSFGEYPFYTSSEILSKFLNEFEYEGDALIFGTGGKASVHFNSAKFSVSTDCFVTKPMSSEVYTKYVHKYLVGNMHLLEEGFKGAGLKHISKEYLSNIEIPLPPLSTQKAIAEKLDKADDLRKKDQELLKSYDELAQSVFIEMFGDPVRNEKGWELESLEKICSKIGSGATPRGGKESYLSEGISLIRSLNVHDQEFKMKDLAFIDDNQAYDLRNVIVEEKDVLFNITGASVCRSCVVPSEILPARVNQHVAILRAKPNRVNFQFLNSVLVFDSKKQQLLNLSTAGGATREAITKQQLEQIEIPVPPLPLQQKFALIVENIEGQKALVKQQAEESENLFQSLLQECFN